MPDVFDDMTPEELRRLREEIDGRLTANQPQEQNVSLTLPDGNTVEGTRDEVQAKLNDFYAEQRRADEQRQQQQQPQQRSEDRPQFDQKQFFEKAEKDWDAGMKYYYDTKYGYDPNALLPLVVAGLNKLQGQVQSQNFERSINSIEGFHASDKNKKVLEDIVKEKNWEGTVDSYRDAFYLAQGRNLLEQPERKSGFPAGTPQPQGSGYAPRPGLDPDNGNFAPPRVGGGGFPEAEINPDVEEFYDRTRDMSSDKVRSLLEQMENKLPM